jgi:predicted DNA-binding protein with PD1-like motif
MKTMLSLILLLLSFSSLSDDRRFIKTPTGYLLVLKQGDQVLDRLEHLMTSEKIPSATLSGIGFVNIEFGFYDFQKKIYLPKSFEKVELASLNGSLAWKEGKPSVHAHGVVTGKDFLAHGGHILKAQVSTGSVEITVTVHEKKLERATDPSIGANVLGL